MAYGWGEHVGELELWLEAPSREEVFEEGVRALGELLAGGESAAPRAVSEHEVAVEGGDLPVLLAEWLGELAFLAETEGFVPDAVEDLELAEGSVRARVRGHRGDPAHLIKAVTYHRLSFEPHGDGWRAVAVLDV